MYFSTLCRLSTVGRIFIPTPVIPGARRRCFGGTEGDCACGGARSHETGADVDISAASTAGLWGAAHSRTWAVRVDGVGEYKACLCLDGPAADARGSAEREINMFREHRRICKHKSR